MFVYFSYCSGVLFANRFIIVIGFQERISAYVFKIICTINWLRMKFVLRRLHIIDFYDILIMELSIKHNFR